MFHQPRQESKFLYLEIPVALDSSQIKLKFILSELMGNTETKDQSGGDRPHEESKGGHSNDNRDILNQLVESDLNSKLVSFSSSTCPVL